MNTGLDTTSVFSYSPTLRQAQYGKKKEDDRLPQINLALVFGENPVFLSIIKS